MINNEQVLRDYHATVTRYTLTDDKKNARDVYIKHLIESYTVKEYGKLIDIIGIEYISLPEDNQRDEAELVMDVFASLLFAMQDYDELRELTKDMPKSGLINLLLMSAVTCEDNPEYHEDYMTCFTDIEDRKIDKEEYINA